MCSFNKIILFCFILFFLLKLHYFLLQAQIVSVDSTLIHSSEFDESNIHVYGFERKGTKNKRRISNQAKGKIFIQNNNGELIYLFKLLTPIDEVIKLNYGKDNLRRLFCSIVYRWGTQYYFASASTKADFVFNTTKRSDEIWESQSIDVFGFSEMNHLRQIKKVSFAHHQPKVFKVEFTDPKLPSRTFAEINGRLELIECLSCRFRD